MMRIAAINWAEGQAPSTVNDSARSMMARISHWLNTLSGNVTMGGASNAYTLTTGESLSAYPSNFRVLWQPNADSTGAVTLNVDAIGAKKVYMPDGTQAGSGDLDADSMYDVAYDGALDSASGGFKIIGFPDAATSGALIASNNLSDLASASTARSNLGVAIGSDVQAYNAGLAFLAGLSFTNEAGFKTGVNLEIGIDVQAWDADLDTYAANPLTSAELGELQNIGATTISATQWGYLGALDQALATTDAVEFSSVRSKVPVDGASTGTLTSANIGAGINLSGNITIPNTIGAAQDTIGPLNSGGASRTITRGSGLSMYVNGTNVASCTLAARGLAVIWFQSATVCYVTGDVS